MGQQPPARIIKPHILLIMFLDLYSRKQEERREQTLAHSYHCCICQHWTTAANPQRICSPHCLLRYEEERKRLVRIRAQARKRHTEVDLSLWDWLHTLQWFGWRCAFCHRAFESLDHLIPMATNGPTSRENCVPSCCACNHAKGALPPNSLPLPMLTRVQSAHDSLLLSIHSSITSSPHMHSRHHHKPSQA